MHRPTRAELVAAAGRTIPDIIAPNLRVLFCGITNLVARSTTAADELAEQEFVDGRRRLAAKVKRYRPRIVAVLGVGAYRMAFEQPRTQLGRQAESLAGAALWVLPNPSSLNANHQLPDLVRLFQALRKAAKPGR